MVVRGSSFGTEFAVTTTDKEGLCTIVNGLRHQTKLRLVLRHRTRVREVVVSLGNREFGREERIRHT